jgi:hypothetical protein
MNRFCMAEFGDAEQLARAIGELSHGGFTQLEAYTPYSTEVVREALGRSRSRLSWLVGAAGIVGASGAYLLQWYLVAYLYPLNVGGRPPHMPLAFVPITFEMGVLAAAFTAFFGVLVGGKLVRLWHPVFEVEGFESASIDRFWLRVRVFDQPGEREHLESELQRAGALCSVFVPERGLPA